MKIKMFQKVANMLVRHYNSAALARRWGSSLKNGAQMKLQPRIDPFCEGDCAPVNNLSCPA